MMTATASNNKSLGMSFLLVNSFHVMNIFSQSVFILSSCKELKHIVYIYIFLNKASFTIYNIRIHTKEVHLI